MKLKSWPRRLCVRHPRWRLQCVAGHCFYHRSVSLSFFLSFSVFCFHFGETPKADFLAFFNFLRPAFGHGCLGHQQSLEYLYNFYFLRKKELYSGVFSDFYGQRSGCKILPYFGGQPKKWKKWKTTFFKFLLTNHTQTKNILYYSLSLDTKTWYFWMHRQLKVFLTHWKLENCGNWKLRDSFNGVVWPFFLTLFMFSIFFKHKHAL